MSFSTILSTFILSLIFLMLNSIANAAPVSIVQESTEAVQRANFPSQLSPKQQKRLQKKVAKHQQKIAKKNGRKTLLIAGALLLIAGIIFVLAAFGAGISAGLFRLILGVPLIIGGLITLLIGAVK